MKRNNSRTLARERVYLLFCSHLLEATWNASTLCTLLGRALPFPWYSIATGPCQPQQAYRKEIASTAGIVRLLDFDEVDLLDFQFLLLRSLM